jgi:rhodanese-related sulfurtransferase
MAAKHSPGFIKIVDEARKHVREVTIHDVKARLDRGEKVLLIDVREDNEFAVEHLPGALHIGKGVIERDIETKIPDPSTEIVLYCGGGYRSALAGASLRQMGYANVISMDGGIRAWRDAGFPLEPGPASR